MYLAREEAGASLPQIGTRWEDATTQPSCTVSTRSVKKLSKTMTLRREVLAMRDRLYRSERA